MEAERLETPLYVACLNGDIETVKTLLNDNRVDINQAASDHGETPFYIACERGHIDIVKLLLNDKRVVTNKPNCDAETPF